MADDIVEWFQGVPIKKSGNRVVLKLGAVAYKKLLQAMSETGLSAYKVIAHSSKPCEKCQPDITIYNKDSKPVKIKRGLLSSYIPENNGINIIQQKQIQGAKSNTDCQANSEA